MIAPHFTAADVARAHATWSCNCGPSALAAITGLTLDEVRPHMGDFEQRGYTNPTLMRSALRSIGRPWVEIDPRERPWPRWGLCRIQFLGPWTEPGVPMRARYRFTHWIGAASRGAGDVGVWDVNAIGNGTGWCARSDWERVIVPELVAGYRRANGGWHITHAIEVERPAPRTVDGPRIHTRPRG